MLETREGIRDSRSLNVAIRGGQGVDDVEIDVVGGAVVGVVNNNVHDFGSRIGDIAKVDGDVVAGPACALGGAAQLPGHRVQGIMPQGWYEGEAVISLLVLVSHVTPNCISLVYFGATKIFGQWSSFKLSYSKGGRNA